MLDVEQVGGITFLNQENLFFVLIYPFRSDNFFYRLFLLNVTVCTLSYMVLKRL
jgi:hypothetical protein